MQDKILYEYAIIRLVPKVERGEYMNIGVILLSKKKRYLSMKYHIDQNKIEVFSKEVDIEEIRHYLSAWEDVCTGAPKGGKIGLLETHLRFRWLTASRSTIIQSSPVHPGFCLELDKQLELLFERFVL